MAEEQAQQAPDAGGKGGETGDHCTVVEVDMQLGKRAIFRAILDHEKIYLVSLRTSKGGLSAF